MLNKTVAIIPARGGSKGIPRKNLRPVAGKPLIFYSIEACLKASSVDHVIVSTDDEEIALFASRFGAQVIMRPANLSDDITTLDPVIEHAAKESEILNGLSDIILTVQATSPLVKPHDIDEALNLFESGVDSVISVVDDRHLCWTVKGQKPIPAYKERVNRQQLPINYKETGAIIACRNEQLKHGSRLGKNVALHVMPQSRSFDIDNLSDLLLCESILQHKKIIFTIIGSKSTGLGHVYRALLLANELVRYEIIFVCEETEDLAVEIISEHNYPIYTAESGKLVDVILRIEPDVVINDILDTDKTYIDRIKDKDIDVINFEDLGTGTQSANLTINSLYCHVDIPNILSGPTYFCLRDEFLHPPLTVNKERLLITFGGIDEGNLTCMTIRYLEGLIRDHDLGVDIVVGPGYKHLDELNKLIQELSSLNLNLVKSTKRISDFMANAKYAVTSAGRTVLELASFQIPMIVICQNDREMTHLFASEKNGIINLGHREGLQKELLQKHFLEILTDDDVCQKLIDRQASLDLHDGKRRVIAEIVNIIEKK